MYKKSNKFLIKPEYSFILQCFANNELVCDFLFIYFLSDLLIFQELLFTGEVFKVENTGKTKSSHTKVPAFTVEYCYTYAVLNYKFYLL